MSLTSTRTARELLGHLRRLSNPRNIEGMARYGIAPASPLGVSVKQLRDLAREVDRDHDVAALLWKSGLHEARILASILEEPDRVTKAQMERWAKGFDSWDLCDQCCANTFEKTPYAWEMVRVWSSRKEEYVKRAAFSLLARLAVSDKETADDRFKRLLPLVKKGATDGRNYVKKAVSWSARQIGKRSIGLHKQALSLAAGLSRSKHDSARWIAKDIMKDLNRPALKAGLGKRKMS